jgi:hypothetical protein
VTIATTVSPQHQPPENQDPREGVPAGAYRVFRRWGAWRLYDPRRRVVLPQDCATLEDAAAWARSLTRRRAAETSERRTP